MKQKLSKALLVVLALCGFVYLSGMDYQDDLNAEKNYCNKVKQGLWPAYNSAIKCD